MADNKLAEKAGWDEDLLRIELHGLLDADLDFSIEATGFETPEIDLILGHAAHDEADETPAPEPGSAVSKPGDLWLLGAHRLYCGDALDASSYEAVLDDARAAAIFTDPPYNVRIDGHVCGKGRVRHDEFAMASGEMSEQEFEGFLSAIFAHVRRQKSLGQSDL